MNQRITKETTVTVERGDYRMVCVGDDKNLAIVRVERLVSDGSAAGVIASSLTPFDVIMLGVLGKEALSAVRGWRSDLEYAALGCKEHGIALPPEGKCPACEAERVPPTLPVETPPDIIPL